MNTELFITKRLAFDSQKSFSRFIIGIATAAVTLSVTVMIVAVSLVNGFQHEITEKVYGYWGHVIITPFGFGQQYEGDRPVEKGQVDIPYIKNIPGVRHIQGFAYKAGIIKANNSIEGVVLKGVTADFDWSYFEHYLVRGHVFQSGDSVPNRSIVISKITAQRLEIDTGDHIEVHFIENIPRVRKLTVTGIYNTGLAEYDERFALVDAGMIQQLNDWDSTEFSGYEIFVDNKDDIDRVNQDIYYNSLSPEVISQTIMEVNPNIFDWLELQSVNKYVIMGLMVVVAIINMITCLLILILERTNMIGMLKAMGATNQNIQKIFVYYGAYIVGVGLIIGNVLGLGLVAAQHFFGFIVLPEESYYVSVAPVQFSVGWYIAINIGTLLVCTVMLLLPSLLISRISPIKAIRFS